MDTLFFHMDYPPKNTARITSEYVSMRSLSIKWPDSPRFVRNKVAISHAYVLGAGGGLDVAAVAALDTALVG